MNAESTDCVCHCAVTVSVTPGPVNVHYHVACGCARSPGDNVTNCKIYNTWHLNYDDYA